MNDFSLKRLKPDIFENQRIRFKKWWIGKWTRSHVMATSKRSVTQILENKSCLVTIFQPKGTTFGSIWHCTYAFIPFQQMIWRMAGHVFTQTLEQINHAINQLRYPARYWPFLWPLSQFPLFDLTTVCSCWRDLLISSCHDRFGAKRAFGSTYRCALISPTEWRFRCEFRRLIGNSWNLMKKERKTI